jgi:hypothetical protein
VMQARGRRQRRRSKSAVVEHAGRAMSGCAICRRMARDHPSSNNRSAVTRWEIIRLPLETAPVTVRVGLRRLRVATRVLLPEPLRHPKQREPHRPALDQRPAVVLPLFRSPASACKCRASPVAGLQSGAGWNGAPGAGTHRVMNAKVSDAQAGQWSLSWTSSQSRHNRAFRSCIPPV